MNLTWATSLGSIQVSPRSRGGSATVGRSRRRGWKVFHSSASWGLGEPSPDVAGVEQVPLAVAADQDLAEVGARSGRRRVADDGELLLVLIFTLSQRGIGLEEAPRGTEEPAYSIDKQKPLVANVSIRISETGMRMSAFVWETSA
jgi:hypothetical protein